MADTKQNIYQKLLEIQKAIIGLSKDSSGFGYKYVSGSKVIDHIKPLMNQYGLLLKQEIISIDNERIDYNTKKGEPKSEMFTSAKFRFTWIDCVTGETDVTEFFANGMNEWEKGIGSAMTYAERYFLLKYFHIATDEDDIDNQQRKPEEETTPPTEEDKARQKERDIAKKYAEDLERLQLKMRECKTLEELTTLYNSLPAKWKKAILTLKDDMKTKLTPSKNKKV